jgi:pimeloyl-ACP methyl ester carboxylesterase
LFEGRAEWLEIRSQKPDVPTHYTEMGDFRTKQPPLLAVWGKNDPFFIPPGAEAFKKDIPAAEVHFFETGHFALETHHQEIAQAIREFLGRKLSQ